MKTIILKAVVWNTQKYILPSGHKATSGYAKDYGYGHEEWNNSAENIWRGQRVFHTEATKKLLEYSASGNLGIIPIASYNKMQYALGIATNVYGNTEEERELISKELNIFHRKNELWILENVKKCFGYDETKFEQHWEENYQWVRWRCPSEHYTWFENPIPLNPKRLTGKQKLTTMHGKFQSITPQIALEITANHIPPEHMSSIWLTTGEFDEAVIKKIPARKRTSGQELRKKYGIPAGNAPPENSFQYWVKGQRTVNPHHATLQAKFVNYLEKQKIIPIENQDYIDVQYSKKGILYFSEIKPTETVESKYAIRTAIGQLLEYRFSSSKSAALEIVIGSKPKEKEMEFVKSIGMAITYYDKQHNTFITA